MKLDIQKLINMLMARPKLILIVIVIIILLFGISSMFTSGDGSGNDGGSYDATVYGINFHIPNGYVESSRGEYTNGEYVDFKKDAWIIEISVSTATYFKESKYIDSKLSKTVNGHDGTLYIYKEPSNRMAYVYYDQGKQIVIRDATFEELDQIVI